jgi:multidrug efflux system membrane fusion protein
MKQISLWVLVIATTVATGCSRGASDAKTALTRAVSVTATSAQTKDVPVQLAAIGSVKAFVTVEIRSMVRGPLARAEFREGDEIKKDDLIFEIDPRSYDATLEQMQAYLERDKAQLAKAEADDRRAMELFKNKLISEAAYDQTRVAVEAAKATVAADLAALNNAQLQLSYCHIKSPVRGRVGMLLVNVGNLVQENDTLLAVVNQTRPVYVDFSVPEQVLAEVRKQMAVGKLPVAVTLPGQNQGSVTGELAVINNTVDTTTGTVLLRALLANDDELLWPGQFVNVSVALSVQRGAVVVPANAVQVGQKGPYVYVIKPDQTVESRLVITGEELGDETVVKEGVQPGEQVVTSNHLRLNPGTQVQIKGAKEPVPKKS